MFNLRESSYSQAGARSPEIEPVFTPQHGFEQGEQGYTGEASHATQQGHRVRKQKKGFLSSIFSCFNPKTKEDRRRKRSISNIFVDKIVRQKRMYYGGPSGPSTPSRFPGTPQHFPGTPPRGSSLTVTDCGHWLAPIWFGFNLMLFILGWMLLAIQYYPMF
uniref:Uncharacterized protein n=1 Tax=Meloidogyne enterolobii TaxID=390850 RepID=A0A6V7VI99_MELEN|nr:unnamed protein product [Meloidogyne enterolobii]